MEGLPAHIFISDDGDPDLKCPSEIGITDRREAELDKLGFLTLATTRTPITPVFFGSQTAQKPKKYDRPEATSNAVIRPGLPYIMAASRFRSLHQGDRPRQDRLVRRGQRCGSAALAVDPQLHQRQPGGRSGFEGEVSTIRSQGDGERDPRAAGLV